MINNSKILSWVIGIYAAIDIFGYSSIVKVDTNLKFFFLVFPIYLLIWEFTILRKQFQSIPPTPKIKYYELIDTSDWMRVFFILFLWHRPLASDFVWGFYLFSFLAFTLIFIFLYIIFIEFIKYKKATMLVIGLSVFVFFLLTRIKSTYVIHYGVPIIGNFFEKPEYYAKYRIEIEPENSTKKYKAIAYIYVEGRTEIEDYGEEDRLGQPIMNTFKYRDVWIKKVFFSNGSVINIDEQDEPLQIGESVFIVDTFGRYWYVTLIDKPIK